MSLILLLLLLLLQWRILLSTVFFVANAADAELEPRWVAILMGRTTTHRIPLLLHPCTSGTSQHCATVEAEDRGTRSAVARETTQAMRKVSTGGEHAHRRHRRRRMSSSLSSLSLPAPSLLPYRVRQEEVRWRGFSPFTLEANPMSSYLLTYNLASLSGPNSARARTQLTLSLMKQFRSNRLTLH